MLAPDGSNPTPENKMAETLLGEVRKGGVAHKQTVDFQVGGTLQEPVVQQLQPPTAAPVASPPVSTAKSDADAEGE